MEAAITYLAIYVEVNMSLYIGSTFSIYGGPLSPISSMISIIADMERS